MKLWLARHAQPLVAPGICYGVTDVAADDIATQVAAQDLASVLPADITMISSPLLRCQQLARAIQVLRPDLSFSTDDRLREMDFGCWDGRRWVDIPKSEYDAWVACFGSYRFGGVECVDEFMLRVAQAWDKAHTTGRDALWIAHAGVFRSASLLAKGVRQIEHAKQWPREAPSFGQWQVLEGQPN